jgi:hypothetical protein
VKSKRWKVERKKAVDSRQKWRGVLPHFNLKLETVKELFKIKIQ